MLHVLIMVEVCHLLLHSSSDKTAAQPSPSCSYLCSSPWSRKARVTEVIVGCAGFIILGSSEKLWDY